MTEHSRQSDAADEITALLVALVLGDASDEQIGQLNELLQRDIEHRRLAVQFLEEEAVLRHQFQMLGRVSDYHNPARELLVTGCTRAFRSSEGLAEAVGSRLRRSASFILLASLLGITIVGALWIGRNSGTGWAPSIAEDENPLRDGEGRGYAPVALEDSAILPRVTKVSWAGPQFASDLEPGPLASTIHEGVVPFISVDGRTAEGFMIQLPPDARLDLVVSADAVGENALAVIEFDSDGRPTGRRISFSNSITEAETALSLSADTPARTRFGPLGTWTERNNSSRSRFYFFTCVNKLVDQSTDDSWHVSRLSVMLDEADLTHIGWDDSGLFRGNDGEHVPDEDYDDLSATIRTYLPNRPSASGAGRLRVLPEPGVPQVDLPDVDAAKVDARTIAVNEILSSGKEEGFPFSVAAGEAMILKVTNRASIPISIAVVEKDTGRTKWSCEHERPRLANTGFCAIKNETLETQQFLLVGRRKAANFDAQQPWLPSAFTVLFDQDAFVTLGLEGGRSNADFDMVKVDMLKMDNL